MVMVSFAVGYIFCFVDEYVFQRLFFHSINSKELKIVAFPGGDDRKNVLHTSSLQIADGMHHFIGETSLFYGRSQGTGG